MGEVDWAEAYIKFLSHTNLSYEEIGKRTIPQLNAIGARLDKHIEIKVGMSLFGKSEASIANEEHSVDDGMAFANMFNGIG